MACKIHCTNTADAAIQAAEANSLENAAAEAQPATPLRFGVNSKTPVDTLLQNNLTEFEWAARNKLYPNFWGRYLSGENALTMEEIEFLHDQRLQNRRALSHRWLQRYGRKRRNARK